MNINIINNKAFQDCAGCGKTQELKTDKNIFQDITGCYLLCYNCDYLTPTEYDDDYINYINIHGKDSLK